MINIITSFFVCKIKNTNIEERNNELTTTLIKNIESPFVEKIHLFIDDDESYDKLKELFNSYLENEKIVIIEKGKKPLYSDFFYYANNSLKNKICMVTNSDIYINRVDEKLIINLPSNTIYALTRHEYDMSCPLINRYQGSHDSFIFKSPLLPKDFIDNLKFTQHNWGSEAKLLQELYKHNIKIFNPCKQIIIVHLHKSDIREENRKWIAHHSYDDKGSNHPPVIIDLIE